LILYVKIGDYVGDLGCLGGCLYCPCSREWLI
jgi:hypothetical protein